ncbi:MAG: hypothetical protein HS132_05340 [Planctomycetia bacterium]|nr:hypothetical protein [Planctomycetia bacterium]
MNTPKSTPEDNELIRAFQCYYWIIVHTNPIIDKLPLIEAPSYIKDQISEFQEIGEVEEESNTLSSYATNILFLRFVGKEIPLFEVDDKKISCVADIKKLWDTLGIKSSKDDFYFYRKVCSSVMAYLEPQYLKIQKELMTRLEPEKQGGTTVISQYKTGKDFVPFSTPSGTQWHEVKISFIDNENVKISAKEETKTKHFVEMGFRKGKTSKPVKSWNILLGFSENECLKFSQSTKSKTEKAIQDLRKRLRTYFGIQDDPIILDQGYRPKFKISKIESQSRSVHTFSNSDIFHEKEDD